MTRRLFLPLTICLTLGLLIGPTRADEPLPTDPRLQSGTLSNGVHWLWLQHANPPGKAAMWIHVRTGSLNEQENERGLSHFLEHMAFNGSEHFPGNTLDDYSESIGMAAGRDINAFTTFDRTSYQLFLPNAESDTLDFGLKVLSDFAFRMLLTPEEVEKERGVVLSEIRDSKAPAARMQKKVFEEVFGESQFGRRWVLGTEDVIGGAPAERVQQYYRRWYRPENITLIVVADAAAESHRAQVAQWFGQPTATGSAPAQHPSGLQPFATARAHVFTDPEWAEGNIVLYGFLPDRPPVTTVSQARVEVVDRLGTWMVNRRLAELVKNGTARYIEAGVGIHRFFGSMMAVGDAHGKPEDWEPMLTQFVAELDRASEHGFLPGEFELARTQLLADAERDVETEPTRDAREIIGAYERSVNDREPILSAPQWLDVLKKVLPTIAVEEVNAHFAEQFGRAQFAYVVEAPEKTDLAVPERNAVLAAARAVWARTTEAPAWEERATELLDHAPQPGHVVESTFDPDTAVTSAWLSNGVRVRHRFMDDKKDTVLVSVTFAGGGLEETAGNAGITTAAALIFDRPATHRLTSSAIEDLMTGAKVTVGGAAEDDTFSFSVAGLPAELERGLQLVYALITDGVIEASAFDKWRDAALQEYALSAKTPTFIAFKAMIDLRNAGDPRTAFMTPEKIERQSVAGAQAWFERMCRTAPLEVIVVGDLAWKDAQPLIEKYVGSLPARPRSAALLDKLRSLPRPPGPYTQDIAAEVETPQAVAVYGFMSTEASNVRDSRALSVAAMALRTSLFKRVREELGMAYTVIAQNQASPMFTDAGVFLAGAPCAQDKGAAVADELAAAFRAFAETGPTAEEIENAKKQIVNELDASLKNPTYWMYLLNGLELHKKTLADVKDIREAYQALTVDDVRATFKKYYTPARTFRVVVTPKGAATGT